MPVDPQRPAQQRSTPAGLFRPGANRRSRPVRRAAARALVAVGAVGGCIGATLAGIAVGGPVQRVLEPGPTAAQERALRAIDAPTRPTAAAARDPRGPNRADLGGGRAELGAAR